MYFPRNLWGDLLSLVLVEGVEYGKQWRHQTVKQRHQTEPG